MPHLLVVAARFLVSQLLLFYQLLFGRLILRSAFTFDFPSSIKTNSNLLTQSRFPIISDKAGTQQQFQIPSELLFHSRPLSRRIRAHQPTASRISSPCRARLHSKTGMELCARQSEASNEEETQ